MGEWFKAHDLPSSLINKLFVMKITILVRYFHFYKIPPKEKEHFARKLIGFSSEQMYNVVADVKHYKQFIPFCTRSTILSKTPNQIHANLEIGFPPIVENYTSIVTLSKPNLVKAVCRDGNLFEYLETTWQFSQGLKSNPQTCIVDFSIKFQFRSVIHSHVAFMFFDRLVNQMENAFFLEAERRYGSPTLQSRPLVAVKS